MSATKKLRLGPLPKTENVKLTFACPASLKADLDRYASLHAQAYGEAVDAEKLIPHMLEAFMAGDRGFRKGTRSEEHKSELQSLMRISYAVFCLKKKNNKEKEHD